MQTSGAEMVISMEITIDRIENGMLVVELSDGRTIDVLRALLPDAAEGDVYMIQKGGAETQHQRIKEKMNRLFCD